MAATLALSLSACASLPHPVVQVAEGTEFGDSGYRANPGAYLTMPLAKLEARLKELQVAVYDMSKEEQSTGLWGSSLPQERAIWMPGDQTVNTRFEVLAHEAAHIFQPRNITRGAASELFAELVAWKVARHYGHDMTTSSGLYLAGWKEGLHFERAYRTDINRVYKILVGKDSVWD